MLLSVVVPSYKAEKFIVKTLKKVKGTLDATRYSYEIICVVDGKVDKTFEKAQRYAKKYPNKIKIFGYKRNFGKGHAVKYGMAKAKGDIIGFVDAGLELNPNGISMLLEHFEWYNADIIIGSKMHPASKVVYPRFRKTLSFGYRMFVQALFGLKVKDTQVGMKFFRKDVIKKILPRLLVKAFAFDIEMLSVSYYLGFRRIYEAPVELKNRNTFNSTIATKGYMKTVYSMLIDTLAVYYRLRIVHYYDSRNRKNWIKFKYLNAK